MSGFFSAASNGVGLSSNGHASRPAPFSIDDAFDIPEDDEACSPTLSNGHAHAHLHSPPETTPIIKNGDLRISMDQDPYGGADKWTERETASQDSSSLVQGGGSGYYGGATPVKYWWLHPKVRSNCRVVLAAFCLVVLGIGLITCGIASYFVPSMHGAQGVVFLVAGIICFIPGAYHIGYIYLAVKGKRGFEFHHLPLLNH